MARRKNNNNSQASGSFNDMSPHESTRIRFTDDDDGDEALDAATESSNLDESMSDKVADDQDVSFVDSDDRTSADYYFDSYSHFGN